jgi:hypothetical protein
LLSTWTDVSFVGYGEQREALRGQRWGLYIRVVCAGSWRLTYIAGAPWSCYFPRPSFLRRMFPKTTRAVTVVSGLKPPPAPLILL